MGIENLRFLVVEDHEVQRMLMKGLLASLGAREIHEAEHGREALAVLERGPPIDIIVCDLMMPDMDGLEFIRHLGEARASVSVIVASALDRWLLASVVAMTRAYGVNLLGALAKPVRRADLLELVSRHGSSGFEVQRKRQFSLSLDEVRKGMSRSEFEAFFQPKVALATGRVIGAECLARWHHPHHGLVDPGAFMPLLEDGGPIDDLLWVMLRDAAVFCRRSLDAGHAMSVSVNISSKSLADVALADRVTATVLAQGVEPRHMVLEVTESAAATNVGMALENLSRLRMRGFGLSIDDYGTGYSSMQQLTRIAFTELKIDRAFVKDAPSHESNRLILESSIEMACRLGIATVAEGVETASEWALLHGLGCDFAQGFLIAEAMPADAYLDWVGQWPSSR